MKRVRMDLAQFTNFIQSRNIEMGDPNEDREPPTRGEFLGEVPLHLRNVLFWATRASEAADEEEESRASTERSEILLNLYIRSLRDRFGIEDNNPEYELVVARGWRVYKSPRIKTTVPMPTLVQ